MGRGAWTRCTPHTRRNQSYELCLPIPVLPTSPPLPSPTSSAALSPATQDAQRAATGARGPTFEERAAYYDPTANYSNGQPQPYDRDETATASTLSLSGSHALSPHHPHQHQQQQHRRRSGQHAPAGGLSSLGTSALLNRLAGARGSSPGRAAAAAAAAAAALPLTHGGAPTSAFGVHSTAPFPASPTAAPGSLPSSPPAAKTTAESGSIAIEMPAGEMGAAGAPGSPGAGGSGGGGGGGRAGGGEEILTPLEPHQRVVLRFDRISSFVPSLLQPPSLLQRTAGAVKQCAKPPEERRAAAAAEKAKGAGATAGGVPKRQILFNVSGKVVPGGYLVHCILTRVAGGCSVR